LFHEISRERNELQGDLNTEKELHDKAKAAIADLQRKASDAEGVTFLMKSQLDEANRELERCGYAIPNPP